MKNIKNYVYKKYIKYSKFQSVLLFHWNISLSANLLFLKSDVGALTCLLTDANTVVLVQQMASSACEIKSLQGTFCANQILQTAGRGPGIKINIYKRLFQNKILLCTFTLSSSLISNSKQICKQEFQKHFCHHLLYFDTYLTSCFYHSIRNKILNFK